MALEADDQYANAWTNLGFEGGGTVDGQQFTEQQCYARAREIDDAHNNVWHNLGLTASTMRLHAGIEGPGLDKVSN